MGLCLLLLVVLLGITESSLSVYFTSPHQVFILMDKVPLHFLFSRLSSLILFNPCLYDRCSSPSVICVGCCWTHSGISLSILTYTYIYMHICIYRVFVCVYIIKKKKVYCKSFPKVDLLKRLAGVISFFPLHRTSILQRHQRANAVYMIHT